MNPILFEMGSFSITWYAFLITVAVIIGIMLLIKEGKRFNISSEFLFNLCFWTLIMGLLGARIYYVVLNWSYYSTNGLEMLKIWHGGLAIHGAIIAGLLTVFLYCKKYSVRLPKITDMISVSLLLGQAIGRWGNFFNSEAHGAATTLDKLLDLHIPEFVINGMNIGGIYYQPTFFYEFLWCLLGVILLLVIRRLKYTKIGTLTCIYFMWYGFGRFFIESMRTDSLMFGPFKAAQIISVIFFVIALLALMIISRKGRFEDLYNQEYEEPIRF